MADWFRGTPRSESLLAEERMALGAVELISEAMARSGVSQAALARRLNVSASEVSQRLSGKRNLSIKSFAAMLHALGYELSAHLVTHRPSFTAQVQSLRPQQRRLDWPMPADQAYRSRELTKVGVHQLSDARAS
ncbi:helix-turn-helix domain-containing protein [Nakamurella leprariae]|uniref:Helix-turn-helix transcriptional regulator n=1 Tax=Nakamurella leprariae TaxID=2803911 RepID=A0A939C0S0_9ACTN|nr:helix-turn-helix transcriptional regulator [Nakamurella leprariae]